MMQAITDFIDKYYMDPIKNDTGYNPVNTLTYALLFVAAVWLLHEHFFKKKKIKIDRDFMKSILGWIIFGGSLRVIEDIGITSSFLFSTPYIYILVFGISFLTLLPSLSLLKTKKIKLIRTWGLAGYTLTALTIIAIIITAKSLNFIGFVMIYAAWLGWLAMFLIIKKYSKKAKTFLTNWNLAAIMAHLLDASGTFVSMTYYGFIEKHVIGNALITYLQANEILLINSSGSWAMFALKLAVVPLILFAIDKYSETEEEKRYLKMIIIILGIGIGIRNSLELLVLG